MSDFKRAVLKVAAENPEFRRALKTELAKVSSVSAAKDVAMNTAMGYSLEVDLKKVFSGSAIVTGIVERRDLKPSSRGWSTGPNTYGEPTYYEVQGTGLNPDTETEILKWLKANKPGLLPGTHEYGHGAYDEVSLSWDRRENAWILVKRFTYTGG